MISRNIFQKVVLLSALYFLAACNQTAPVVGEITPQPSTTIMTGAEASLAVPVQGTDLKFEWSALRGKLTDPTKPSVIYTAPGTPGLDTVTVKVIYSGGEIIKTINFDVTESAPPTATAMPLPADTPTSTTAPEPTAAPPPIACNHPSVTKNLFPQLADVKGQFPMYGPEGDSHILCQAVYDLVHTPGKMAVHFKYDNVGKNFGWWGIATPNGYDASRYKQLCFWAYAQVPNQSFRVKMKDQAKYEPRDVEVVILTTSNNWEPICTDISIFSDAGVQLDKMDNVNLGFEQPTGSAEIWIADFEFK